MYPSTPSGWQKSVVFKRKLGEWERGKNAQRAITTDTEFIADSPFCKAVKLPQFQDGIISRSPMSVTVPAQTTWLETCVWQLAAYRTVGDKIHPSWSRIHGRIWSLTVQPAVSFQQKNWRHPVGMLLFLNSVPSARSCYWEVLTQSHQHETVQFFLYHINQK